MNNLTSDARREAVRTANHAITLDGKAAKIAGFKNDFATVIAIDSGVRFDWSWDAAIRIAHTTGHFKS